ncbi:MAG: hypothetical protein FWF05_00530 [Oscillospiraceae bacterium]|nr:hypothetical protein [Oscillospiraceae bacterium]
MKKMWKKALALIIAVVMIMSVGVVMSNAKTQKPDPVIIVPGIGMSRTTLYDENNVPIPGFDVWTVFNLYSDELMDNIWSVIPPALLSLVLQRDVGLTSALQKYGPSLFKYAQHDETGHSVENIQALQFNYPISEYAKDDKDYFYRMLPIRDYIQDYGEENIYQFNFPAFSNTYEQAENLHNYIQLVKQQTGAKQVTLLPVSLGGTVTNAYFDLYRDKRDVSKVINVVAAYDGSDMVADMMTKNYADDADRLLYNEIIPQLIDENYSYLINVALRLFPRQFLRNLIDNILDTVIAEFIVNTPSLWALVPHERYPELADKLLSDPSKAEIRKLTDRYYNVQKNLPDIVEELTGKYGIEIFNIAGCGLKFGTGWDGDYQYFQFFKSGATSNSDGIIQISSTAMGTDSVPVGEKYPADGAAGKKVYCTNPAHNHIYDSLNASTCYLPERTWYFIGQHHEIAYNDVAVRLACKIMLGEIDNVHSDPAFPQFNGSRYIKNIYRDYLPRVANIDRDALTEDQLKVLDAAVAEAELLLESTVADDAECKRVTELLYNALVYCGVYEKPADPAAFDQFIDKLLKGLSDVTDKVVGRRGFTDVILFRKY